MADQTKGGCAELPCLVIAGPSGVGKGTIIKCLKKNHPGVFGFSVSHATRAPREGEQDGVHYNFVTVEEFERLIAENAFLEYAKVHGNYYGTSYAAIEAVTKNGQLCILDIDVQGSRSARKAGIAGTYIFVSPPSMEELERRLRGRGTETEESILRRLETTAFEMAATDEVVRGKPLFDAVYCNDILEETVQVFEHLLKDHIDTVKGVLAAKAGATAAPEQHLSAAAGGGADAATAAAAEPTAPKTVTEKLSVGWMATHTVEVAEGEQCVFSAKVAGGAKLGIKIIFKPATSTIAHLLCKSAAASGVDGLFEPSESGELIIEFDNTKASMLSFSRSVDVKSTSSPSKRSAHRSTLVNHLKIQELLERCPPDAPDVATALSSALTFSARNAELARGAYAPVLEEVNAAGLDCRGFGVGAYHFFV